MKSFANVLFSILSLFTFPTANGDLIATYHNSEELSGGCPEVCPPVGSFVTYGTMYTCYVQMYLNYNQCSLAGYIELGGNFTSTCAGPQPDTEAAHYFATFDIMQLFYLDIPVFGGGNWGNSFLQIEFESPVEEPCEIRLDTMTLDAHKTCGLDIEQMKGAEPIGIVEPGRTTWDFAFPDSSPIVGLLTNNTAAKCGGAMKALNLSGMKYDFVAAFPVTDTTTTSTTTSTDAAEVTATDLGSSTEGRLRFIRDLRHYDSAAVFPGVAPPVDWKFF